MNSSGTSRTAPPSRPALRLVGAPVARAQQALPLKDASPAEQMAVAAENRAASMSALDPRWALAVRANSLLQGGKAALLPPESRRLLTSLGKDLSLRPFDTNLIIAIVQDAARAGRDPLGAEAKLRLKMVPPPAAQGGQSGGGLLRLVGAVMMAGVLAWFLIRAFGA